MELTLTEQTTKNYDKICATTFYFIQNFTKDCDVVPLAPFNPNNKEHLFVLNIAKGVGGVEQKDVEVDVTRFQLWRLNRKINKEYHYKRINGKNITYAIDPAKLLNYVREYATKVTGEENFNFGKIYDAFYNMKGNN
jgi:hypothetical protein